MFLGNYEKTFGWKTHNICIFLVKIYVENNGKFHTKLYVVTPHGVTAPVGTGRNGKPLRRRGARTSGAWGRRKVAGCSGIDPGTVRLAVRRYAGCISRQPAVDGGCLQRHRQRSVPLSRSLTPLDPQRTAQASHSVYASARSNRASIRLQARSASASS